MTQDQYSSIGKKFKEVAPKAMLRADLLTPAFISAVGDIKGKTCLDLACGDGYYTRLLMDLGARRVVGVDISQKMIDLAKAEEHKPHQGIEYLTGNVADMPPLGEFDLVSAVFLLHYASSKEELLKICQSAAKSTKPKGKFVTINTNPAYPLREDHKYSFSRIAKEPLGEGSILTLSHYQGHKKMYSFDFYHWSRETYEWALREAGFRHIEWRVPQVPKEAEEREGQEFWEDYKQHPNHSIITCTK